MAQERPLLLTAQPAEQVAPQAVVAWRTTVIFGAIEIAIMLALAFTFLANPGPGSHYAAPLQPHNAPNTSRASWPAWCSRCSR